MKSIKTGVTLLVATAMTASALSPAFAAPRHYRHHHHGHGAGAAAAAGIIGLGIAGAAAAAARERERRYYYEGRYYDYDDCWYEYRRGRRIMVCD